MTLARQPDWNDVFFGAALEPDRWPDALATMASHTGSSHGQLIGVGGARDIPFNIASGLTPSILKDFVDIGGASPTLNYRVAAGAEDVVHGNYDGVVYEKHYDAVMPSLRSDTYVEWCRQIDIPFGCQTNLVVDRIGLVGFATLRKQKEGRTTPQQRRVFASAASAARRAVRLQERLEGDQANLLAGAFDAIHAGAFILDARGKVQALTQSAERIVSAGVISLQNNILEAAGTPLSLAQAVAALTAEHGLDHLRLRVDPSNAQPPIFMEGFRLPARAWSLGHLPHAILLIRPPQRDRAGIAAFLGALYGLTSAEADIAMRLFDGASRQDIASRRGVTDETLRGQIKQACAKAGARSEADLMRLLAAIMS